MLLFNTHIPRIFPTKRDSKVFKFTHSKKSQQPTGKTLCAQKSASPAVWPTRNLKVFQWTHGQVPNTSRRHNQDSRSSRLYPAIYFFSKTNNIESTTLFFLFRRRVRGQFNILFFSRHSLRHFLLRLAELTAPKVLS